MTYNEVFPQIWDLCMSAGMPDHAGTGLEQVIAFLESKKVVNDSPPTSSPHHQMTNNKTEGVEDLAAQFQKECHKTVASILRNTDTSSYQDATNVWLFRKLAELQLEIDQLKANQIINPYELK